VSPRRSLGIFLITGLFAAGCGVGRHSETDAEHATPYLANASVGSIGVRAARIVLAGSAASGTTGTSAPQAYLLATLVNDSDTADTLTSATVAGGAVQAAARVSVPAQQAIQLGEPDLGLTGPVLTVGALSTPLQVGTTQQVTFTFQNAGTRVLQVPVIESSDVGTTASAAPVSSSG
jgi:copper(I)-binding protein